MTEQRPPEKRDELDQAKTAERTRVEPAVSAPEFGSDTGSFQRRLSSFGPPKGVGERRSLYDRLVESGALDADLEAVQGAREPLEVDTPQRLRTNAQEEHVRDLADELEPSRDTLDPGRPSSMPLRDSDLNFVAEVRDSGGFVSALGQDPDADADEPPAPRVRRPPDPPVRTALPSVVLSPQISTRYDSTERISTAAQLPRTHPLANSMAPTTAPRSERPGSGRRTSGLWLGLSAAAVVALAVGFVSYRGADSAERQSAATVQPRAETEVRATAQKAAEPEPAQPPVEATPPAPAQASAPAESDRDAARAERRRLREEARAARAAQSGGSAGSAATPAGNKALGSQPTREEVVTAMTSVMPSLRECVGDKHGLADVTVTVRGAGNVSYALVAGTFVGTPEGSCIARVVKEARFPAFSEPFVRITYPFQL